MNRLKLPLACGLLAIACATTGHAQDTAKPAVVVNGQPISQTLVDAALRERAARGQKSTPELADAVKQDLALRLALAQEAAKAGLDRDPLVAAELAWQRDALLSQAYVQRYLAAHPPTDAALQAEYDKVKAGLGDKEYKLRHIVVKTEPEARQVLNKLHHGGNFAKLAKQYSIDPNSKDKGGEIQWTAGGVMLPPIKDAVAKLAKGKLPAAPVATPMGYHILELEDVRPLQLPPLAQLKPQLVQRVQQAQVNQLLADVKSRSKIELPAN